MTDLDVGLEWRWCQEEQPIEGKDRFVDAHRALIRKLVEDRARHYYNGVATALCDFGIDPATYPAHVEKEKKE